MDELVNGQISDAWHKSLLLSSFTPEALNYCEVHNTVAVGIAFIIPDQVKRIAVACHYHRQSHCSSSNFEACTGSSEVS